MNKNPIIHRFASLSEIGGFVHFEISLHHPKATYSSGEYCVDRNIF